MLILRASTRGSTSLTCERDVCAIARALVDRSSAVMNLVHVAEAHRGRGLCGRVVQALLAETPASRFELEVDKKNAAARMLQGRRIH